MNFNDTQLKMTPGKLMGFSTILCMVVSVIGYYTCEDKAKLNTNSVTEGVKSFKDIWGCKSVKIATAINGLVLLFVLYRLFTLKCF